MASRIQKVADAVVAMLEAGEAANVFSKAIVTERSYETTTDLEDTDIISVLVVPVESNRTRKSQGTFYYDVLLDIQVRKRFSASQIDDNGMVERELVDEYVALLEQIDDYLALPENAILDTFTDAQYIEDDSKESDSSIMREIGIRYPWVPKDLIEKHQYTGVTRVGYHVECAYS